MGIVVTTNETDRRVELDLIRVALLDWYEGRLSVANPHPAATPWRSIDVDASSILVGELLLDRFDLHRARQHYYRFVNDFPRWESIASSDVKRLQASLPPTGTWRKRAITLKHLAQLKVRGQKAPSMHQLGQLPGISATSAALVRSIVFELPEPQMSSELKRFLCRLRGEQRLEASSDTTEDAVALFQHPEHVRLNWAVKQFTSQICVIDEPDCPNCPLLARCHFGST